MYRPGDHEVSVQVTTSTVRQAGKSTLTRLAAAGRPGTVVRLLDDAATLRAAQDDPAGFVEHDRLMVIDEIQLAPELLRAIKVLVDLDPRPGRFLLTGSSRVLALRTLPDALPGRMEVIELWPFSQGDMFRLLALLAGRVSGLLVPGTLAGQVGIPRTTLVRYLELLATVFLIKTVPAWSAMAVGTPKLAFVDTGIVCHLIGQDAARLDEPDGAAGQVLENLVVMELARQQDQSPAHRRTLAPSPMTARSSSAPLHTQPSLLT